jgi:hypothetical protein
MKPFLLVLSHDSDLFHNSDLFHDSDLFLNQLFQL